jgi:hypothetical protein
MCTRVRRRGRRVALPRRAWARIPDRLCIWFGSVCSKFSQNFATKLLPEVNSKVEDQVTLYHFYKGLHELLVNM